MSMSFNESVKDEDVLSGLAFLHEVVASGFDQLHGEINQVRGLIDQVRREMVNGISKVRDEMATGFAQVRADISGLEERLDQHEARIVSLEALP
jgi:hypothetical protein